MLKRRSAQVTCEYCGEAHALGSMHDEYAYVSTGPSRPDGHLYGLLATWPEPDPATRKRVFLDLDPWPDAEPGQEPKTVPQDQRRATSAGRDDQGDRGFASGDQGAEMSDFADTPRTPTDNESGR